jgi:hypothetical protein
MPLLLTFLLRMCFALRTFGGEKVKTLVQTTLKSEILTFFTEKAQESRSRAKPACS